MVHVLVVAGAAEGVVDLGVVRPACGAGPPPGWTVRPAQTAAGDGAADADLVIAADGGADALLASGRMPDLLVGDLDSITAAALAACVAAGVDVHELPAAKDESDTEYALRVAVERGATHITVVGALGGPRLDHLLANVLLLTAPWLVSCDVRLIDARYEVTLARGDIRLHGRPGDLVSLLPLTVAVADVETDGLAYPLRGERLLMGASRGVSNVLQDSEARVRHGEGALLVVHDRGGPGPEEAILHGRSI